MNPVRTPLDYIRRYEERQTFKPKARRLGLAMAILPRLNDLIRRSEQRGHYAHWLFRSHKLNVPLAVAP